MKVVGIDVFEVPVKFQANRSSVAHEKMELPLLSCFYPNLKTASVIGYFGWDYF